MTKYKINKVCAVDTWEDIEKNEKRKKGKFVGNANWIAAIAVVGVIALIVSTTWISIDNMNISLEIGTPEPLEFEINGSGLFDGIGDAIDTIGEWFELLGQGADDFFTDLNFTEIIENVFNESDYVQDILDALNIENIEDLNINDLFNATFNETLSAELVKNFFHEVITIGMNSSIPDAWRTPLLIVINNGGLFTASIRLRLLAGFEGYLSYTLIDGDLKVKARSSGTISITVQQIFMAIVQMSADIIVDAIYDILTSEGELDESFFSDWFSDNFEALEPVGKADLGFYYGFIGAQATANLNLFELFNATGGF